MRKKMSDRDFVVIWNEAKYGSGEVAQSTGIKKSEVVLIANRLRRQGWELKKFKAGLSFRRSQVIDPTPEEIKAATEELKAKHLEQKKACR